MVLHGRGLRSAAFLGAAVTMTTQPIVTKLSQVHGRFDYAIITVTLLAEVTKLTFSACALVAKAVRTRHAHGGSTLRALDALCPRSLGQFVRYGVPSLVYMANNNLVFVVLTFISATTFQIFACMKTIMTGATMHATGMKRLTAVQMAAVLLLACSIFMVTSPSDPEALADVGSLRGGPQGVLIGLVLSLITCALSTGAGVYNELLMKGERAVTIHWQNMQMYTWGVILNGAVLFLQDRQRIRQEGLLAGYNAFTWGVVANNALTGLCISAVLKFLDNIARVYAHGFAMLATFVIEVAFFRHPLEPKLIAAIWVTVASSYVYNLPLVRRPTVDKATQDDDYFFDATADAHTARHSGDGHGVFVGVGVGKPSPDALDGVEAGAHNGAGHMPWPVNGDRTIAAPVRDNCDAVGPTPVWRPHAGYTKLI